MTHLRQLFQQGKFASFIHRSQRFLDVVKSIMSYDSFICQNHQPDSFQVKLLGQLKMNSNYRIFSPISRFFGSQSLVQTLCPTYRRGIKTMVLYEAGPSEIQAS